jgi:hypothetical protein
MTINSLTRAGQCENRVKCWDSLTRQCLLDAGHLGGCNPFSKPIASKLIPVCPKCGIPRTMIVAPKSSAEEIVNAYCAECSTLVEIGKLQFKAL